MTIETRVPVSEAAPAPEPPPPPDAPISPRGAGWRPTIIPSPNEMTRIADEAEAALMRTPSLEVFQRARELVTIARDSACNLPGLVFAPGEPCIVPLPLAALREKIDSAAAWMAIGKKKKDEDQQLVPIDAPMQVAVTLAARAAWNFRPLESVTETPTLRPDGTLLDTLGYDPATGILFEPPYGIAWPAIPAAPTDQQVRDALALLHQPFCDFPFEAGHHRSAALAATITVILRPAFAGPSPLFLIRSNTPGSGKGLIASVIGVIAQGREPARMAQAENEAEDRKRITALAQAGARIVLVDNVTGGFGNGTLDGALTSTDWEDRLLGGNKIWKGHIFAVWLVTGNNVQLRGDMPRRVVPIELLTQQEDPERRSDFTHPNLLDWVRENRVLLVVAALTLVRAFIVAGRPVPRDLSPMGSYEGWSNLVRGALTWAGEPDPAAGRDAVRATADPALQAMRAVLHAWRDLYGNSPTALAQVHRDLIAAPERAEHQALADALTELAPAKAGGWTATSAGYRFRNYQRRIIDRLRLEPVEGSKRAGNLWAVSEVAQTAEGELGTEV